MPMESSAMFTEPEQEDDVPIAASDMSPVKVTSYQNTGEAQNHQMSVVEAAQLERGNAPINYNHDVPPMEPMDFRNPGPSDPDPDPHNMNVLIPQFAEDQVTSLFLDPSINFPDPPLDFEWLFDNLSADLNSTGGGSAGMPSGTSPYSNTSLTDTSPPALPVPSPAHIRHPSSTQSSASSPWAEVRANLLKALSTLDPNILMSSFFYPNHLAGFWDLYFENYHPHFPILHKHTLDPVKASPLLVAAIVTLGSTLSGDAVHYDAANKIHDSLRYLIFGVSFIRSSSWFGYLILIRSKDSNHARKKKRC
jgi:Fungal specific transcription factor domain